MIDWNEERIQKLETLWAGGKSASQIALEMGGLTRNAIIGKVHRLKLAKRDKDDCSRKHIGYATKKFWTPEKLARLREMRLSGVYNYAIAREIGVSEDTIKRKSMKLGLPARSPGCPAGARQQARKPSGPRFATSLPFEQPENPIALVDLQRHHCRWPVGEEGVHLFCGGTAADRQPYCERHCGMAYRGTARVPYNERGSFVVFRPVLGGRVVGRAA